MNSKKLLLLATLVSSPVVAQKAPTFWECSMTQQSNGRTQGPIIYRVGTQTWDAWNARQGTWMPIIKCPKKNSSYIMHEVSCRFSEDASQNRYTQEIYKKSFIESEQRYTQKWVSHRYSMDKRSGDMRYRYQVDFDQPGGRRYSHQDIQYSGRCLRISDPALRPH